MIDIADTPLAALKPAPWNPRTIKDERFKNLVRSIQADPKFLYRRPILATADGTIYAGNMRYRAAEHLKMASVPAIIEDIPEQLAKERALRDNQQWGEWHEDELAELLYTLNEAGSAIDLLGFDQKEIDRLLSSVSGDGGLTDEDAVPEAPEEPVTKPGDLWLLGEHRVLCGDSTKAEDLDRLMGSERAACLWTDPPYGVEYVGKTKDALKIQNDGAEGLPGLLAAAFGGVNEVMRDGCPFYVAHPAGALSLVFWQAVAGAGWKIHEGLVWVKDSMVLGHSDYHYRHEPILYGWKPGGDRTWIGGRSETSVFEIPRPKASPDHPTGKPVALVEAHLRNSSGLGGVVLDPFLGSGTTLIACEKLGRRCYGMEIAENYTDVIVRRWQDFTGREATLEATGETFARVVERVKAEGRTSDTPHQPPSPSSAARSTGRSSIVD